MAFREYYLLNLQVSDPFSASGRMGDDLLYWLISAAAGVLWLMLFILGLRKREQWAPKGVIARAPNLLVRSFSFLALMLPGLFKWIISIPAGVSYGYWMALFAVFLVSLMCTYANGNAEEPTD